jgi:hypothetical protein
MSGLYMLADALLGALAAKLERDVLLSKVKELETSGASPEAITDELRKMRDAAISAAQTEINSQI